MNCTSIYILGGSGFVGRRIAGSLIAQGKRVRIPTRQREIHKDLLVLPGLEMIEADIYDSASLRRLFDGMDCVINLVGILNEKQHNGEGFRRAHIELPKRILDTCQQLNIPRLLHMSALHADVAGSPSHYLRSKAEGENILQNFAPAGLHVTSFRPSVIFGPGDSFFNRFAALLKTVPLVFPLACPESRFAPVYVGDVAARFVNALDDSASYRRRYDLCGPQQYTLRQLVAYTARTLGLKRLIIGLPDAASRLQASLLEWFPGKPFSLDNYQSLQVDSVCAEGAFEPTSVESIVPLYIGHKSMQNRYDRYRSIARR